MALMAAEKSLLSIAPIKIFCWVLYMYVPNRMSERIIIVQKITIILVLKYTAIFLLYNYMFTRIFTE